MLLKSYRDFNLNKLYEISEQLREREMVIMLSQKLMTFRQKWLIVDSSEFGFESL